VRFPRPNKKQLVAIALASGLVLGAGGIAAAYFSATGTGTATASVARPVPFKVTVHTKSGIVGPGDPTVITFAVANTHPRATGTFPEAATDPQAHVVTDTGLVTTSGHAVAGCKSSWFTATASSMFRSTTGGTTLGTHPLVAYDHNVRDAVTVTMATTGTQDSCIGVEPAVVLTIGG
jgi:hypothetical protein